VVTEGALTTPRETQMMPSYAACGLDLRLAFPALSYPPQGTRTLAIQDSWDLPAHAAAAFSRAHMMCAWS
jgi:hypothetical protein